MADYYRAGFTRHGPTSPKDEDFTQGRTTVGTPAQIAGFLRRTDDGSNGLLVITNPASSAWRSGFRRAPHPVTGDLTLGQLHAIQEVGTINDVGAYNPATNSFATASVASVYWRGGFLREVSTDRLVWCLPTVLGLQARMWNGFMRSIRGDLILD